MAALNVTWIMMGFSAVEFSAALHVVQTFAETLLGLFAYVWIGETSLCVRSVNSLHLHDEEWPH